MELSPEVSAIASLLLRDPSDVDVARLDRERFATAVHRNRAPLGVVNLEISATERPPTWVTDLLSLEKARLNQQQEGFRHVLGVLASRGIRSLLIKAAGYFPYTSDNIDVLIAEPELPDAARALRTLGYREVHHLREPYKWFFKTLGQSPLPPIHVHTQVAWINVFIDGRGVLDRGVQSELGPACFFPSADDILLVTVAHAVYEDKLITLRDIFHMWHALRSGIDVDRVRSIPRARGWERGFTLGCDWIAGLGAALEIPEPEALTQLVADRGSKAGPRRRGTYGAVAHTRTRTRTAPVPISKPYIKGLHFQKAWADSTITLEQKMKESIQLIWFAILVKSGPLRRSDSVIVALCGQDGSGKTTVASATTDLLSPFAARSSYHWIRLGSSPFLESIKSLLEIPSKPSRKKPSTEAGSESSIGSSRRERLEQHPLLKEVWCWVLSADFLTRSWLATIAARARGGVHVFDRYTPDAEVDIAVGYGFGQHKTVALLGPKPDLGVLLATPPTTAVARSVTPRSQRDALQSHALYSQLGAAFELVCDASRATPRDIAIAVAESALNVADAKRQRADSGPEQPDHGKVMQR
ncbi:MAG: hypothetical protein QOD46_1302 [Actinomycetota bacterium]|nr:hypothetical protein [Actinomycetota bacterium]